MYLAVSHHRSSSIKRPVLRFGNIEETERTGTEIRIISHEILLLRRFRVKRTQEEERSGVKVRV